MASNEFPAGLSSAEVAARQAASGYNELSADEGRSLGRIAAEVLREPMFLLLLGAGSIYLLMGDVHEAMILLGFVFVIMGITIFHISREFDQIDTEQLTALKDTPS